MYGMRRSSAWQRSLWLSVVMVSLGAATARGVDYPLVFVQEPASPATAAGPRVSVLQPDGRLRVLTEGFAAAAEPAVSFDGQRILFAGKLRADDPWDIWEMAADGSGKLRITDGLGDCREPVYLATAAVDAPNFRDKVRWITFTSTAPQALDERGVGPLASLYAVSLRPVPDRGQVVWRTTYNLGGDRSPTILRDGRVLFSAWHRTGFALMTISWAGENLNPLYGSHDGSVSQVSACEVPESRSVIFIETEGSSPDDAGRLARISFRRPLRSHEVLSPPGERYRTPHPAPAGELLVSWRGDGDTFGIYRFDLERARRQGRLFDAEDWHDVDAQPLVARPEPVGRIPQVDFASVLDVGEYRDVGQLQCMNVYDTDRPEYADLPLDAVTSVRLIEGIPLPLPGSRGPWPASADDPIDPDPAWPPTFVRTRSLGEAPVEEDGSFYVNVAGDLPFYIETLDREGHVVQTMKAWMWLRAGDQRGCMGCHENKELGPENRVTEALRRARPTTLVGSRPPGAAKGRR